MRKQTLGFTPEGGPKLAEEKTAPVYVPPVTVPVVSEYACCDNHNQEEFIPNYVALDGIVLRFFGYYKEQLAPAAGAVSSTATLAGVLGSDPRRMNTERIHTVAFLFYMVDGTGELSELRQMNSGCEHAQGRIVRRQRIPKADGSFLQATDLNIGVTIEVFGRAVTLDACDAATRDYMTKNMGVEVPENRPCPVDTYVAARQSEDAMRAGRTHRTANAEDSALARFLVHDRDVLRFFGVWLDEQGDVRHMVVHYFLVDDTIEVRERVPPNAGRDPNSLFLRRQRLPRAVGSDEYIGVNDLYIGAVMPLLGREIRIYGCDARTRAYYLETLHADPSLFPERPEKPRELEAKAMPHADPQVPDFVPYATIGSDRDSRVSCYTLHQEEVYRPRPLHSEYDPACVLRISMRLTGSSAPSAIDAERPFTMLYRPYDDTVSVIERPGPQGFIPGVFIARLPLNEKLNGVQISFGNILEAAGRGSLIKIQQHEFISLGPENEGTRRFLLENYGWEDPAGAQ